MTQTAVDFGSMEKLAELMQQKKPLHFVGIDGAGMSALASVFIKHGFSVSGSDQKESINTIRLRDEGATVFIGHDAAHIKNNSILIVSTAIRLDNPEILEAANNKFPIFKRAQLLGYLMSRFEHSIAFAGTHGKTTTSAMASVVFSRAELRPTFLVGGEVTDLGHFSSSGDSPYFIAEADESDSSIVYLQPRLFVLNNIEKDHLDHFGGLEDIVDLFENCVERLSNKENPVLVINNEQWGNELLLKRLKVQENLKKIKLVTFGLSEKADLRAANIRYKGKGTIYTFINRGAVVGEIELSVPGEHNIINSLAVIAVAQECGLDFNKIKVAIKSFTGARRRFTLIGKVKGVAVYDDYAHHPTEIKATLAAARHVFPEARIICAFQPHRYSRTFFFMNDFVESLTHADKIIVTQLYSAGEDPIPGVSSEEIVRRLNSNGTERAIYIDKKDDIAGYLEQEIKKGDVLFTMGAGDIYTVGKELMNRLKSRKNGESGTQNAKIIRIA